MDTTKEALEPERELEWESFTFSREDKGESFPEADSSPIHPTNQRVIGAKEMSETGGEVCDEDRGGPSHTPGKSDAGD